ncbi:YSIRK-type signal peptide-containing protein [Gemella sp.]
MRFQYKDGEKLIRFSIRKYHFGATSVAIASLIFFGGVSAKAENIPTIQTGTECSAAVEAPNRETVTPARSARGRRGLTVVQSETSTTPKVEKTTFNKETSLNELPTYTNGVDNYKLSDKNTLEGLSRTNGSPGYYNRRLESHAGETAKSDDMLEKITSNTAVVYRFQLHGRDKYTISFKTTNPHKTKMKSLYYTAGYHLQQ